MNYMLAYRMDFRLLPIEKIQLEINPRREK